ncbi:17775_t:CDS:2 [Entrophospora sp. SA101]|nr:9426_t:CDS:2 [Entrophospora sp. SA101]CAJ0767169.1 2140_t:CDS:2 [Entrophospora sp. SA101]CAJ0769295.1 17768_t:CDS:2 [Entrophospora sp. SA101]CAJ0769302.1 17775_t:CDS:2 [Entrophospora sp. SA101]CAJ0824511.1 7158_t:CDS:2 [Entrophospora sp. SA101]
MSTFTLPIIDISSFTTTTKKTQEVDELKLKTAKEIHEACMKTGFFYIKGHNVPKEICDNVLNLGREFFKLSQEEKNKLSISNEDYRLGENVTRYQKDWHEALDYYKPIPPTHPLVIGNLPLKGENRWPEHPSEFRKVFEEYIEYMKDLGAKVMSAIALGLGALEVRTKNGDWIQADPIPDAFVVNIGDMLNIWTNNLYQSTLHRVIHKSDDYRVSVPFFYEPNFDAKINPIEQCLKIDPIKHYDSVIYGEHLIKKVTVNFEVA